MFQTDESRPLKSSDVRTLDLVFTLYTLVQPIRSAALVLPTAYCTRNALRAVQNQRASVRQVSFRNFIRGFDSPTGDAAAMPAAIRRSSGMCVNEGSAAP